MQKWVNEFSKLIVLVGVVVGVGNIVMYWISIMNGFYPDVSTVHDSLALIIAPFVTYATMQTKRAQSLNQNRLTIDDKGTVTKIDKETFRG